MWKHLCDLSHRHVFLWTVPLQCVHLLNYFLMLSSTWSTRLPSPCLCMPYLGPTNTELQPCRPTPPTASKNGIKPMPQTWLWNCLNMCYKSSCNSKSSWKYFQGESSPHPLLYAHCVEDHPLHHLPFYIIPLSSAEHHTPLAQLSIIAHSSIKQLHSF